MAFAPYPQAVEVGDGGWGPAATVKVRELVEPYRREGLDGIGRICHHQLPTRLALAVVDFHEVPWGTLPKEAVSRLMRPIRRRAVVKRGQVAFLNADAGTLAYLRERHRSDLGIPWAVPEPLPGEVARFIGRRKDLGHALPASEKAWAKRRERFALLAARDGCHCVWCGVPLEADDGNTTFDHALPASLGGPAEPDNLLLACVLCNGGRMDRSIEDWLAVCRRLDLGVNEQAVARAIVRRDLRLAAREVASGAAEAASAG